MVVDADPTTEKYENSELFLFKAMILVGWCS